LFKWFDHRAMMIEEYNDKRGLKAMSTKRKWPKGDC